MILSWPIQVIFASVANSNEHGDVTKCYKVLHQKGSLGLPGQVVRRMQHFVTLQWLLPPAWGLNVLNKTERFSRLPRSSRVRPPGETCWVMQHLKRNETFSAFFHGGFGCRPICGVLCDSRRLYGLQTRVP